MLEKLDSPKHLVAMRLSGGMTASDVEQAYKAIEEAIKTNDRISFFAEVDPSLHLTAQGLFKDAIEGLSHIGKMKHYYRAAVVTDKGWMAAAARVEGLVFSSIDVRVFEPGDRDKAFAWASEKPVSAPKPKEPKRAVHFLKTSSERVVAYEVDGRIGEKDIVAAAAELKEAFAGPGKINVLGRIKNWEGFDLSSVINDDYVKVKFQALSKVEKYAIIGGPAWMRNFIELMQPLFSVEMRVFDATEEEAAWDFVGARQALLAE
jgi:hypothetical protein